MQAANRVATLRRTITVGWVAALLLAGGCKSLPTDYQALPTSAPNVTNGAITQQAVLQVPKSLERIYVPDGTTVLYVPEPTNLQGDTYPVRLCVKKTYSNQGHPEEKQDANEKFPEMGVQYIASRYRMDLRPYGTQRKTRDNPVTQSVELVVELPESIDVFQSKYHKDKSDSEKWSQVTWDSLPQQEYQQLQAAAFAQATDPTRVRGYSLSKYREKGKR
ncbi:hypothetical protein [Aeoliella mucimassa]|uniref:Lipoprotein n=1 Tax=Aeoliella mucimassa TaxID=2527972 RepID=A0A518AHB4_9BACT|nr:hypothetical protein [Aeoliella mucimassa]QDU54099.1 hypothetical protein Pan181_02790 [Aeoliella mucimassa]